MLFMDLLKFPLSNISVKCNGETINNTRSDIHLSCVSEKGMNYFSDVLHYEVDIDTENNTINIKGDNSQKIKEFWLIFTCCGPFSWNGQYNLSTNSWSDKYYEKRCELFEFTNEIAKNKRNA